MPSKTSKEPRIADAPFHTAYSVLIIPRAHHKWQHLQPVQRFASNNYIVAFDQNFPLALVRFFLRFRNWIGKRVSCGKWMGNKKNVCKNNISHWELEPESMIKSEALIIIIARQQQQKFPVVESIYVL